jgi:hypothetical protein
MKTATFRSAAWLAMPLAALALIGCPQPPETGGADDPADPGVAKVTTVFTADGAKTINAFIAELAGTKGNVNLADIESLTVTVTEVSLDYAGADSDEDEGEEPDGEEVEDDEGEGEGPDEGDGEEPDEEPDGEGEQPVEKQVGPEPGAGAGPDTEDDAEEDETDAEDDEADEDDSDDEDEKVVIFEGELVVDLLDLTQISEVLSSAEVPAGRYTKIRLSIENPQLVLVGGDPAAPITDIHLTANGHLFISEEFELADGEDMLLMLDFGGIHLVQQGHGGFVLTPQLRADLEQMTATAKLRGAVVSVDTATQTFLLDVGDDEGEEAAEPPVEVDYSQAVLVLDDEAGTPASEADLLALPMVRVEGTLWVDGGIEASLVLIEPVVDETETEEPPAEEPPAEEPPAEEPPAEEPPAE